MEEQKREYLKKYDKLQICLVRDGDSRDQAVTTEIQISRIIGEGSTCVTYEGTYRPSDFDYPVLIVLKELYPNIPGIVRRPDKSIDTKNISSHEEFIQRKSQFEDNLDAYRLVARRPELKVTIPKLIGVGYRKGKPLYHIFEAYRGKPLLAVDWKKTSIYEQLNVVKNLAEYLKLWYEKGFMLLDLSPSNIVYLEELRTLQFIDFDSLLVKRGERWEKAVSGYRTNEEYLPEALYQAMGSGTGTPDRDRIERLLGENTCFYFLGKQMYTMLCPNGTGTRIKAEAGAKLYIRELEKRYPSLAKGDVWPDIQKNTSGLICKLLSSEIGKGYKSFDEIIEDLDFILGLLRREMDPKIISQRYEILAGNMIEKFPAYKYFSYVGSEKQYVYEWDKIKYENVEKTIDVLIAGDHEMRKALIKYLISCLQMSHVSIRLHLFSNDIKVFWRQLELSWPLIGKVCRVTLHSGRGDETWSKEIDQTLVKRELAEVHLYPVSDSTEISEKCFDKNIRYLILLDNDTLNQEILEKASSDKSGIERFVAVLFKKTVPSCSAINKNILLFLMSEKSASDALDTELRNNRIYNRGFFVHASYALGNNPYTSKKSLRNEYDNDPYYQSSSIRPALHAAYKLVSVGIDPESETAAWEYYRKVLGHEEVLLEQMTLEHCSWTAFMIMNGAKRPISVGDIDEYAFTGKMTWKDDRDKDHMIHPCVAASSSRRGLNEKLWDEFDEIEKMESVEPFLADADCDELDKASMRVHFILKSGRKRLGDDIDKNLKMLQESRLYQEESAFRTTIDELIAVWSSLKDEEGVYDGIKRWGELIDDAKAYIGDNGKCKDYIDRITVAAKPFTSLSLRHDFKKSDEDIVRAVPQLFLRTDTPYGKSIGTFSVMRFLTGNKWVDLRAALYTEPEKLILLADYQDPWLNYRKYKIDCKQLLEQCEITTTVEIRDKSTMDSLLDGSYVFFDLTGPDGSFLDSGSLVMAGENTHYILYNGNTFVGIDSDHSIEILKKRPALSVKEWMCLHDCSIVDQEDRQQREKLRIKNTIHLWNIMRTLAKAAGNPGDDASTGWDVFMDMLKKWRTKLTYKVKTDNPGIYSQYTAEVDAGELQRTGLQKMLRKLASKGIIDSLSFAKDEEDDQECITFGSVHEEVARKLCEICRSITKDHKVSAVLNHDAVCIKYSCRKIVMNEDRLTDAEKRILDNQEFKKLFAKILKQDPVKDGQRIITFRSNTVFEALDSSEELLKSIIYAECSRKNVFDALAVDCDFVKCGIDYDTHIMGISDNYFYPIVITDCTDDRELRLKAIDMMYALSGTVLYFITSRERLTRKEGGGYCCLTPDDVDSCLVDGTYVLKLAEVLKQLIKNKNHSIV